MQNQVIKVFPSRIFLINFSFQAIFYYDAAIATGPFITTFIDVLGISLFFAVAKYLLKL